MKDNKKVALCLAYTGQNYGMLLQAFATQTIIENLGWDTEIIDYHRTGLKKIRISYGLLVSEAKKIGKKLSGKKEVSTVLDANHQKNAEMRKQTAEQFRKRRLHNIISIQGIDMLEEYAKKCASVLVGSDQQWLPDIAFSNFRTLRFVPNNVNKVSYATSLGVSEYPNYCKKEAAQFLKRIDHISVREESGKKIIEELVDNDVTVVLDPTYLLTREEWLALIPYVRQYTEPYLLCYFLGENKKAQEIARLYAKEHGLKVISIMSDEVCADEYSFSDCVVTGEGPETFVNLIRGAECVMTDSFHGIAFSVINQRPFYVFYRKRNGVQSRNTRIDNILTTWGVNDRLIQGQSDVTKAKPIDYEKIQVVMDALRDKSLDFLANALNNN